MSSLSGGEVVAQSTTTVMQSIRRRSLLILSLEKVQYFLAPNGNKVSLHQKETETPQGGTISLNDIKMFKGTH